MVRVWVPTPSGWVECWLLLILMGSPDHLEFGHPLPVVPHRPSELMFAPLCRTTTAWLAMPHQLTELERPGPGLCLLCGKYGEQIEKPTDCACGQVLRPSRPEYGSDLVCDQCGAIWRVRRSLWCCECGNSWTTKVRAGLASRAEMSGNTWITEVRVGLTARAGMSGGSTGQTGIPSGPSELPLTIWPPTPSTTPDAGEEDVPEVTGLTALAGESASNHPDVSDGGVSEAVKHHQHQLEQQTWIIRRMQFYLHRTHQRQMQQQQSIAQLRGEIAQLQQMLILQAQVFELSHLVGELQGRFQDLFENQVDVQDALAQLDRGMASLQETVQEQQGRLHQLQDLVHVQSMQLQSLGLQRVWVGDS